MGICSRCQIAFDISIKPHIIILHVAQKAAFLPFRPPMRVNISIKTLWRTLKSKVYFEAFKMTDFFLLFRFKL